MISLMMPRESWVAKWNELRQVIPGVYAVNVPKYEEDDDDDLIYRGPAASGPKKKK